MKEIAAIDHAILMFFERISHWFERLTGKNNFWQAGCVLTLMIGVGIWQMLSEYSEEPRMFAFFFVSLFALAYVGPSFVQGVGNQLRYQGGRNPLELPPVLIVMRVYFLPYLVGVVAKAFKDFSLPTLLGNFGLVVLLYLISLTPLKRGGEETK